MKLSASLGVLAAGMALLVYALTSPPQASAVTVEPSAVVNDSICGPRCAQHVLRYFHIDEDLIKLTREIQGLQIEKGCSMHSLQQALDRRNIFTRVIQLSSLAQLHWNEPAVIHTLGADKRGHFVVIDSSVDGVMLLWDGLSSHTTASAQLMWRARSGVVLLTSSRAITSARLAEAVRGTNMRLLVAVVIAWDCVLGLTACVMAARYCVVRIHEREHSTRENYKWR